MYTINPKAITVFLKRVIMNKNGNIKDPKMFNLMENRKRRGTEYKAKPRWQIKHKCIILHLKGLNAPIKGRDYEIE